MKPGAGWGYVGCPDCGHVTTVPLDRIEAPPWCFHNGGSIRWVGPTDPEHQSSIRMVRVDVVERGAGAAGGRTTAVVEVREVGELERGMKVWTADYGFRRVVSVGGRGESVMPIRFNGVGKVLYRAEDHVLVASNVHTATGGSPVPLREESDESE